MDIIYIDELVYYAGLDESLIPSIEADLLTYKKAFCLSGFVPGKELSDDETAAYMEFMDKYDVDSITAYKMMQFFMEYRFELAAQIG